MSLIKLVNPDPRPPPPPPPAPPGPPGPPPPILLDIDETAAWVNCCISSGFWRMISSIPGSADLNIVFVIWSIIALPPSWNRSFNSGDIFALDLYFSWSSPKISSYSFRFSLTCSDQPSSFRSNGSNLLFKNSRPVIQARSIFPWNFTLFWRSRSSIWVSYSPFISA